MLDAGTKQWQIISAGPIQKPAPRRFTPGNSPIEIRPCFIKINSGGLDKKETDEACPCH